MDGQLSEIKCQYMWGKFGSMIYEAERLFFTAEGKCRGNFKILDLRFQILDLGTVKWRVKLPKAP
ncbi:MAG: hypothetical protein EA341_00885 [Mongoliibacter sp.]|nr:MAG: hypothetical protein EA341_00885 [Mongoliibacter sp.]